MGKREDLHEEFCELLGSRNAYFNPPESVKMQYEAIRYGLGTKNFRRANNKVYNSTNQYEGVVISRDPDTKTPDKLIAHFEMCSLGRPYNSDNLTHYPFTLYY